MSLGAAGCGNPESRCEYLTGTLFGFRCKKYDADLRLWKGEPLRLRKCSDDAHKEWERYRAEQRKKERGVKADVTSVTVVAVNYYET